MEVTSSVKLCKIPGKHLKGEKYLHKNTDPPRSRFSFSNCGQIEENFKKPQRGFFAEYSQLTLVMKLLKNPNLFKRF